MRCKDLSIFCFALAESDYKSPAAEKILHTISRRILAGASVINNLMIAIVNNRGFNRFDVLAACSVMELSTLTLFYIFTV